MYFYADEMAMLIRTVWRYHVKVRYDKLWRLGLFEYGEFERQNVLRADGNSEQ